MKVTLQDKGKMKKRTGKVIICKQCGKKKYCGPYLLKMRPCQYCSIKCANKSRQKGSFKICKFCGKKKYYNLGLLNWHPCNYCSKECYLKSRKKGRIKACKLCGRKKYYNLCELRKRNLDYCSKCSHKILGKQLGGKNHISKVLPLEEFKQHQKKAGKEGGIIAGNKLAKENPEHFKKMHRGYQIWIKEHPEEFRQKQMKAGIEAGKGILRRYPRGIGWQGGKSFEPYTPEFNEKFKEKIRKRDNYRCQECYEHQLNLFRIINKGEKIEHYNLIVHHIDYNKKNIDPSNLISLCLPCHLPTNFNREKWTKHFQEKIKKLQ